MTPLKALSTALPTSDLAHGLATDCKSDPGSSFLGVAEAIFTPLKPLSTSDLAHGLATERKSDPGRSFLGGAEAILTPLKPLSMGLPTSDLAHGLATDRKSDPGRSFLGGAEAILTPLKALSTGLPTSDLAHGLATDRKSDPGSSFLGVAEAILTPLKPLSMGSPTSDLAHGLATERKSDPGRSFLGGAEAILTPLQRRSTGLPTSDLAHAPVSYVWGPKMGPLAGQRIGEAKVPGPVGTVQRNLLDFFGPAGPSQVQKEQSPRLLTERHLFRFAVANPTSILNKAVECNQIASDLLLLSETSAVSRVQQIMGGQFRQHGCSAVWGDPVAPHSSARDGPTSPRIRRRNHWLR